jgi:hypothetical protein
VAATEPSRDIPEHWRRRRSKPYGARRLATNCTSPSSPISASRRSRGFRLEPPSLIGRCASGQAERSVAFQRYFDRAVYRDALVEQFDVDRPREGHCQQAIEERRGTFPNTGAMRRGVLLVQSSVGDAYG